MSRLLYVKMTNYSTSGHKNSEGKESNENFQDNGSAFYNPDEKEITFLQTRACVINGEI